MSKIDKPKNEIKEAAVRDNAAAEMHSCIEDIRQIIDNGRKAAYLSVNAVMVQTYWNIGKRIVEEEQNGKERADYGKKIIKQLAAELSFEYGNGFSERNLRNFRAFYLKFPDSEIWQTRLPNLTWSQYRRSTIRSAKSADGVGTIPATELEPLRKTYACRK